MSQRTPIAAFSRRKSLTGVAVLSVIGALLLPVSAATADDHAIVVSTAEELQAAVTTSETAATIRLAANIPEGGSTSLSVGRTVTIDLNGQQLTTSNAGVTLGATLTIADTSAAEEGTWTATGVGNTAGINVRNGTLVIESGTVTATGGTNAAGIGGGVFSDGGTTIINGGTVTATGGDRGAGIGGGDEGAGGTTTVTGGTVTATGGGSAAGIGGGFLAPGGITSITGGTVTATGGIDGAGIGGGDTGSGGTTTVDGGTITATGGSRGAGIGGGFLRPGGTSTINAGTITATGGFEAAGIGGGFGDSGGTTTINGGTVTATGGTSGAGIGGGFIGTGGTTIINGGTITATGGIDAPGIGGGLANGQSGTVTIGSVGSDGPSVSAAGGTVGVAGINASTLSLRSGSLSGGALDATTTIETNAVFDLSADLGTTDVGPFTNNGTLNLQGPVTVPGSRTVTNNGVIAGPERIEGSGTIVNNGSICAPFNDIAASPFDPQTGLTVTGNAYYLPLNDPSLTGLISNRVYAPTFAEGCVGLPDVSTDEQVHVGWTVGVDGPFVGLDTPLSDVDGITAGVETTLEAALVDAELTIEPGSAFSAAGEPVTVTVRGPRPLSNELLSDLTADAVLTGEGITAGDAPGTFTTTTAGETTVTATVQQFSIERQRTLTGTLTYTTLPSALDVLDVEASATTVQQGGSVTLDVVGTDEFGNELFIFPGDITVTSDVPTDIIDGLTVTFPTASPHTLTVTVGDVSATVVIEVEAAAVIPRPNAESPATAGSGGTLTTTGPSDTSPLGAAGLLMIVLGALAIIAGRATRIQTRR